MDQQHVLPSGPKQSWTAVQGAARDQFNFYHKSASGSDTNGLWEYCRYCVSNLVWINDHFVVTPNPLYLAAAGQDFVARAKDVVDCLYTYFESRRILNAPPVDEDHCPPQEHL